MIYLPPFVVHGTHSMNEEGYLENAKLYAKALKYLEDNNPNLVELAKYEYFNDWVTNKIS